MELEYIGINFIKIGMLVLLEYILYIKGWWWYVAKKIFVILAVTRAGPWGETKERALARWAWGQGRMSLN